MEFESIITSELKESALVLEKFMSNPVSIEQIQKAATHIADAIRNGKKVISCGNGGSHCDAMHFAEELSGRYRDNRKALPAIAISDVSHITCTGNDYGFEYIFSRFVEGLGQSGDVLLGISTSGNSANVIRACETARLRGMTVIALTGKDGGELGPFADVEIRVPHYGYADRIQEVHIKIIHILILLIEKMVA
ncbi:D-sedoheptulose 7-phosphate isomerase [Cytophagaceae bacterium DM2B3-1]|uniref:Phosphoheptose isomerase n=1 Tax=Xanthocytophaga flava TaxID=3048013 RepID=A0ABT7CQ76_9BACT|nr:D-sedoheptulose 7-phosphate isomerase [Xanthocytophaga flavus]MDJ1468006.1 D-sedoheptulose 7-phosphate isomerase [Xanthocytophaga flavus]MDJ1495900.1 D-sedoheptulose 7-phosphate isomerase [Xanthocytophaga flavus]